MNGRCETDPLDRAINVCDSCYGEFCASCLVSPKGRRHPICTECAIAASGVRGRADVTLRGPKKSAKKRREELANVEPDPMDEEVFTFFDVDRDLDGRDTDGRDTDGSGVDQEQVHQSKGAKRKIKKRKATEKVEASQPESQPDGGQAKKPRADEQRDETVDAVVDPEAEPLQAELPQSADRDQRTPIDQGLDLALGDGAPSTPAVERLARIKEEAKRDLEPGADLHAAEPDASHEVTPDLPVAPPTAVSPAQEAQAREAPAEEAAPEVPAVVEPVVAVTPPSEIPPSERSAPGAPGAKSPERQQSDEAAAKAAARRQRRTSSAARAALPDRRKNPTEEAPAKQLTAPMIGEVRTLGGRRRTDNVEPEPMQIEGAPLDTESGNAMIAALNAIDQFDSDQSGSEQGGGDESGTPRKADTDSNGNWVPPVLRGMATDARDAGADLPKRRRSE